MKLLKSYAKESYSKEKGERCKIVNKILIVLIINTVFSWGFIMYQMLCCKGHGEEQGGWHAAVHGVVKSRTEQLNERQWMGINLSLTITLWSKWLICLYYRGRNWGSEHLQILSDRVRIHT